MKSLDKKHNTEYDGGKNNYKSPSEGNEWKNEKQKSLSMILSVLDI